MTIRVRNQLGQNPIGKVRVRSQLGLHDIAKVSVRTQAGLSLVWSASGPSISPDYVSGYGASNSAIYVTSNAATIVGAPAGATIVWHSDNGAISAVTPGAVSTVFRAHLASGTTQTASIYATVNGVDTAPITCDLTNGGIA